jgi:hypothetical protein
MTRRSVISGVCILGLLPVILAAGCGRADERVPAAKHGVGRLVYKQLVAVSRAAALEPEIEEADEEGDGEDTNDSAPPAPRADVPPEPWVAAFPVPDLPPMPTVQEPPRAEDPPAETLAAAPAEPPLPEPGAAPVDVEPPAEEILPDPQVVVYVPGSEDEGAAAAAAMAPTPVGVSIVNVVVVNPIFAGRGHGVAPPSAMRRTPEQTRPHRPSRPHVAAKPALPTRSVGPLHPLTRVR